MKKLTKNKLIQRQCENIKFINIYFCGNLIAEDIKYGDVPTLSCLETHKAMPNLWSERTDLDRSNHIHICFYSGFRHVKSKTNDKPDIYWHAFIDTIAVNYM